jgi:hypothetical protein
MACITCRFARPLYGVPMLHCMGPRGPEIYPASMPDWHYLPNSELCHWESTIYHVPLTFDAPCPVYEEGEYQAPPPRHPQGL